VQHKGCESFEAFEAAAHMRLLGVRQEQIAVVNNLLYPLYGDVRILRICHANCQKALRRGADLQPPSWRVANHLPGELGERQLLGVRV
jgi:hypothetical protein